MHWEPSWGWLSSAMDGRESVFETFKAGWRQLRRGKPGKRFVDFYRRRQEKRTSKAGHVLWLVIGSALLLVGVVLLVIPGPGIPLVFLGAGFVAQESRWVAQTMDTVEVWIRGVIRWVRRKWSRSVA